MAHGALFAGVVANGILFNGRTLASYTQRLLVVAAIVLLFVPGRLLAFVPVLARTRRTGLGEYGSLAQQYVREFDLKWLCGGGPPSGPTTGSPDIMGSPDIQSLADLSQAYDIIADMRLLPLSWKTAARLAAVTLLPLAPLSLTMISDTELASMLMKLLF